MNRSINSLAVGKNTLKFNSDKSDGGYVKLNGESFYRIANYDTMLPFFMSIVSPSDHWMFISSTGGLSAGRNTPDSALFPYYTDDKISNTADLTGSKTLLRIARDNHSALWEPFSDHYKGIYSIKRNLYKNILGNTILFEEINEDLQCSFSYSWQFSEKYGFVKKSILRNLANNAQKIELLDGIQNVLPYGVNSGLQNDRSNLATAYRKSELEIEEGIGLFLLSAIIVDKAEPSEALKATTVWSAGVDPKHYLLSGIQLDRFRANIPIENEIDVKAETGAYFVSFNLELAKLQSEEWYIIADINQDHANIAQLKHDITNNKDLLLEELRQDIVQGSDKLNFLVGLADGLQLTGDRLGVGRHFSNVLFNIMRGGIFEDQYNTEADDFGSYVNSINRSVYTQHGELLKNLPDELTLDELLTIANGTNDLDLIRICYEYLPLTFSRRHGDPSRPWNKFSIEIKKEDGTPNRNYQGNWRDIFQNWEALAISFPGYIDSMISKFLNASTIDGYNPYRITEEGIDWEVIEEDDPWSYIGYWGDHQIIYLLKLLEISFTHKKQNLLHFLSSPYFVYANVPYRIKNYNEILSNPKDTIDYDVQKEQHIQESVEAIGADGKLCTNKNKQLTKANLTEKLLVTLLAKLSNFIPEAGIWLNTQRPEWNDANNALVGNGVSMVTLYYIHRYVSFCQTLFTNATDESYELNAPVLTMFSCINACLLKHHDLLNDAISDSDRKSVMDELGICGEKYRTDAYNSFSGQTQLIDRQAIIAFLTLVDEYVDHSIKANERKDGLYHTYNLVSTTENLASVDHLYEMLEGQTAVLSAGYLNGDEVLKVLDALKNSKIYREDQYSYMLYPDRTLPRFLEKNNIPKSFVEESTLANKLLKNNDKSIIIEDVNGDFHFKGTFTNANDLKKALSELDRTEYAEEIHHDSPEFLKVYEQIFDHKAFTGRSGTFFGYEGLGSIYWHMVSKLLLAIQENIVSASSAGANNGIVSKLIDYYYEVRAGIGINKPPELYGAIPTDPYSHTPGNKGAQQPGMTGQVKEDIINRWAELGVSVQDGCLSFRPIFLSPNEFLQEKEIFEYYDIEGHLRSVDIEKNELAFTYCQLPIIYNKGDNSEMLLIFEDGERQLIEGAILPEKLSLEIFERSGLLELIRVQIGS